MLFQMVAIHPSERWTWEMRNSSMWIEIAAVSLA
jgi:hypothetical protein